MSVLSYLTNLSSEITISDRERDLIDASTNTLFRKLESYFTNIELLFAFGSYDRKTILRRSKDSNSDVDIMISFVDGSNWAPQTLMNRLKRFAETKYSSNEIYQSSPTIVLELSHIKFELVPSYYSFGTRYIPGPANGYSTWIASYPYLMKSNLNNKNKDNNYVIRKLVRLLKYWNILNNKVYSSYDLEEYIINKNFFFCSNLKDYFYNAVEGLSSHNLPSYKETKVNSLKRIVSQTKKYELDNYPILAEATIKGIFV